MASGELATVIVKITADATDFLTNLDQATTSMTTFAATAATMMAAGTTITTALVAATEQGSKYETEIFNLNAQTGIATTTLSALGAAADAQGLSFSNVQVAIRKLGQEVQSSILSPGGQAAQIFKDLGVSVTDTDGTIKPLNDLLPELADALGNVSNSTEKSTYASDLYGRSSAGLIPILANGSEVLQEFAQVAQDAGVNITQSQADQGKAFQLMQNIAELSLRGLATTIGDTFLPSFTSLISSITTHIQQLTQWAAENPQVVKTVSDLAVGLIGAGGLMAGIAGVYTALGLLTPAFVASINPVLGLVVAIALLSANLYAQGDQVTSVADDIGSKLTGAMSIAIGKLGDLAGAAGFTGLQDSLKTTQFNLGTTSQNLLDSANAGTKTTDATSKFKDTLDKLVQSLKATGDAHAGTLAPIDSFGKAVDEMVAKVLGNSKADQELYAALVKLTNAGVDGDAVIQQYGSQIMKLTDTLIANGVPLNDLLRYYRDLVITHEADTEAVNNYSDSQKTANDIITNSIAKLNAYVVAGADSRQELKSITAEWTSFYDYIDRAETNALKRTNDSTKQEIQNIRDILAEDTEAHQKRSDQAAALEQLNEMLNVKLASEYQTILDLESAGQDKYNGDTISKLKALSDQQIADIKALQDAINQIQKQAGKDNDTYWKNFYTSAQQAADNMEKSMATAFGDISTGLASTLAKDIVTWSNWGTSLIKLGQDIATKMLTAFLDGLMNPLTNALKQLGKSLADALSGALGGGSGGGGIFGTILSSIIGFFDQGTPYVPQTGLAVVHQGERIITASDNAALMRGNVASIPGLANVPSAGGMASGGSDMSQTNALLQTMINLLSQTSTAKIYMNATQVGIAIYKGNRFSGVQIAGQQ